jgi:hypothetical protein
MGEVTKTKQRCYRIEVSDGDYGCADTSFGSIELSWPAGTYGGGITRHERCSIPNAEAARSIISILQDYLQARHEADQDEARHA